MCELGSVTPLRIGHAPLEGGQISREIELLSFLMELKLKHGNRAKLPSQIGSMQMFQGLSLQGIHLVGTIPELLLGLTKLTTLDISNNKLEGPISTQLVSMTGLEHRVLDSNDVASVPTELGVSSDLSNLTTQ